MEPIHNPPQRYALPRLDEYKEMLRSADVEVTITDKDVRDDLIGKAREDALERLEAAAEAEAPPIKLSEYANRVKKFMDNLENEPANNRAKVARTLQTLAQARITNKESKWNPIYKIFHKLGQFFQGHGFQTKAEWAIQLKDRITRFDTQPIEETLKQQIYNHRKGVMKDSRAIKEKVNALSRAEFNNLLDNVIFSKQERHRINETGNKFVFFNSLSPEQKEDFYTKLLSKTDWYEWAEDILGVWEERDFIPSEEYLTTIKNFVTPAMAEKFDPLAKINKRQNATLKNNRLYDLLLEKKIKGLIENKEFEAIADIMKNPDVAIFSKSVVRGFTPAEKTALEENVKAFQKPTPKADEGK